MDTNKDNRNVQEKFLDDYKSFYDNAPDMFWSVDPDTLKIIKCNQSVVNVTGYSMEELIGKPVEEMYHPKCHDRLKANVKSLKKTGQQVFHELMILTKNGETIEVDMNITLAYDEEGNLISSRTIFRDITQLKETQRKLKVEIERSEHLLLNILPKEIADELKIHQFVKPTLYDSVTVMFADFVGFSKISDEVSPEELVSKLDSYFSLFDSISGKYNLEKLKTIGDAYMCAGGIPIQNETHAMDCCLAAVEMQEKVQEIFTSQQKQGNLAFNVRIGINTGVVIAGVIGKKKFAYDVWGDAVNLASRLESNGLPGKINISKSTYELVKNDFLCEYRGKIKIKNMGSVEMYFLDK